MLSKIVEIRKNYIVLTRLFLLVHFGIIGLIILTDGYFRQLLLQNGLSQHDAKKDSFFNNYYTDLITNVCLPLFLCLFTKMLEDNSRQRLLITFGCHRKNSNIIYTKHMQMKITRSIANILFVFFFY